MIGSTLALGDERVAELRTPAPRMTYKQNRIFCFNPIITGISLLSNILSKNEVFGRQCYHFLMQRAGFVLVGGGSTRMGTNKALLRLGDETLVESAASKVASAIGSVALIGDPDRYRPFGYPVYADRNPGCGPIGGLQTILSLGLAEWNLLVACDMPRISGSLLSTLIAKIEGTPAQSACIVPLGPDGPEPLCAIYHATCLPAVDWAISARRFKMRDLLFELNMIPFTPSDSAVFTNVNTPADWRGVLARINE